MSRNRIHRLGDLQLRIMQILWARVEATVADVHEALAKERDLAYTTIATMLRKMEARGLVRHRLDGRSFVYRAAVREEDVSLGMADHLVDRLFEGSLSDMVHHLLTTREVSREELSKLGKMIAEMKKRHDELISAHIFLAQDFGDYRGRSRFGRLFVCAGSTMVPGGDLAKDALPGGARNQLRARAFRVVWLGTGCAGANF